MVASAVCDRRLKVLHLGKFYPPHRGGMESHLKTLCEQLLRDVDLEVVVSNTGSETVREVVNGVPVTRLARFARLASTSLNPAMAAGIRRSDADLIHLHWPNPMAAIAYLMSGHAGSLVVTYHSDVVKQRVLGNIFAPVLRAVLLRSRAIIVSSPDYLETSAVLKEYREQCWVVPFGISDQYFAVPDEKSVRDIRARYGGKILLSVGRLVDYKGFVPLIQAMARTPGRLLIAGKGPMRRELMTLTQSLCLEDRVIFLGGPSDEELRNLYHAADVFVLASTDRREAFGLVQAEAMAAGKPVINTSLASGVPFVSPGDVTGLTVPPSDAIALAGAITRLLEDAPLRLSLARTAGRRAETMFRASTMAARTLQIYRDIVSPGRIAGQRELAANRI